MTKKTVGAVASELMQKEPDKISIQEQQEAMQQDYMKNLLEAVDRGYKKYDGDFFVEVQTKNEKLLPNVFRNYFIDRVSCPTPNYDQSLFRYNRKKGEVEYIWTIPSREACHHLKNNQLEVVNEEQQLLRFVLMFDNGTLFLMCKKFNGEQIDSPLLNKETNGSDLV